MEKQENQKKCKRIEELNEDEVATLLQRWELDEFVDFTREKKIDGRKLLEVSEGIVKLWKPKVNAKKLVKFIEDIRLNPFKYLDKKDNTTTQKSQADREDNVTNVGVETDEPKENDNFDIESQYQTIPIRKKEEKTNASAMSTVEEIIRRIVPAKSFLYRHQQRTERSPSYLPMDAGTPKKKKLFRLSSYEYPFLDIKARFSRQESSNDRGYCPMKTNSAYYTSRPYKKSESKTKYKSLSTSEELNEKYQEDHFYEDLCYNEVEKVTEKSVELRVVSVKPCMVKIQELFQSFKVPFFRRPDMIEHKKVEEVEDTKDTNLYENDSTANMYDSVHVNRQPSEEPQATQAKLPVEEYLEPVLLSKDYCDVNYKQKEESLMGYILSIFENRFGMKRETQDEHQSSDSEFDHKVESSPAEEASKWGEERKHGRTNMADRPLPVPVENEPYYMNIDRGEAHNLLKGQPDGTFVLRPSSQPDHAYTLSVSCANAVHNVGIRRRPDGRLSLGFARRGEASFATVTSLLRHHRKRRLLLVAGGDVIGATTLNESPHYYQSPSSIPIPIVN